MPSAFEKKRSEKYSFYDYVDITIDMHFQHPRTPLIFVSPEIRNIFLSFCMVFGSSQRIDNIIFRLRSKGANE